MFNYSESKDSSVPKGVKEEKIGCWFEKQSFNICTQLLFSMQLIQYAWESHDLKMRTLLLKMAMYQLTISEQFVLCLQEMQGEIRNDQDRIEGIKNNFYNIGYMQNRNACLSKIKQQADEISCLWQAGASRAKKKENKKILRMLYEQEKALSDWIQQWIQEGIEHAYPKLYTKIEAAFAHLHVESPRFFSMRDIPVEIEDKQ